MREIKFRAWDNRFDRYAKPENIRLNISNGDTHGKYSGGNVNDWTIEQYTGLKDKNGFEIYENDIVKNSNGKIREVGYNERRCQFGLYSRELECWITNEIIGESLEIIGNIHESPIN